MNEIVEDDDSLIDEDPAFCYKMSELALADWLSPEEDEAWAYMQPKVDADPATP